MLTGIIILTLIALSFAGYKVMTTDKLDFYTGTANFLAKNGSPVFK